MDAGDMKRPGIEPGSFMFKVEITAYRASNFELFRNISSTVL
jgi:hypothetical protein